MPLMLHMAVASVHALVNVFDATLTADTLVALITAASASSIRELALVLIFEIDSLLR